jgi:trk system potassium uptake protein TrkA
VYIVVVGGGKIGYYLTKHLAAKGHEVLLIEATSSRADQLSTELGDTVLEGDATEPTLFERAGPERADVVVAVTGNDEANLVVCQMAKNRHGVKKTVARLNNPFNGRIFKALDVDVVLDVTGIIEDLVGKELGISLREEAPSPS